MTLAIQWGFLPKEVRDAARPHIINYLWLIPSWVHTLRVQYQTVDPDDSGSTASMNSNHAYRHAVLTIYGLWMSESPARRERIILHELIHPTNAPLVIAVHELAKACVDPGSIGYKIGMESIRSTSEGATVDLERALFGLYRPPPPFTEEEDEQAPAADLAQSPGQVTSEVPRHPPPEAG